MRSHKYRKTFPFLTTMNQVITLIGMRININNIRTNQTTEESPILFFSKFGPTVATLEFWECHILSVFKAFRDTLEILLEITFRDF